MKTPSRNNVRLLESDQTLLQPQHEKNRPERNRASSSSSSSSSRFLPLHDSYVKDEATTSSNRRASLMRGHRVRAMAVLTRHVPGSYMKAKKIEEEMIL